MKRKSLALLPITLILLCIFFFYLYGLEHTLNYQTIQAEHAKWSHYADAHPFSAALYFIGIYILSVVLVIPDSTLLTLIGGLLFPLPLAILYSSVAETIGAMIFFAATRYASIQSLPLKKIKKLKEIQYRFLANQANYLLFLRFSHLLPFWLINLCAGVFHVRVWTFLWTTWIGVLPLSFLFSQGGTELSAYLQTHAHFTISGVFTLKIKILLFVIGCLALAPILIKKWRRP